MGGVLESEDSIMIIQLSTVSYYVLSALLIHKRYDIIERVCLWGMKVLRGFVYGVWKY